MAVDPRKHSRVLLEGTDRSAARAMMKAVGFTDEDLKRPQIGVAHCWIGTMPCNWNHRKLAEKVMQGIRAAGGTPIEVNTISVTDGITMGTEGMKGSLISREVVADSVELLLDRIDTVDVHVNAVCTPHPDALAQADALDAERREGRVRGPLHGLAVLVKDNVDTHDLPTTAGSLALADVPPPVRDAELVRRMRDAGESVEEVSRFLDHSSLAVTTTYLRRLEGQEDRSWAKVAEAIGV